MSLVCPLGGVRRGAAPRRNCRVKIYAPGTKTPYCEATGLTPWLTQCVTCRTEATTTRACESAK